MGVRSDTTVTLVRGALSAGVCGGDVLAAERLRCPQNSSTIPSTATMLTLVRQEALGASSPTKVTWGGFLPQCAGVRVQVLGSSVEV